MKDELARAIKEHDEAYKEVQEFFDKWVGTGKVLTPEALERWRLLREREKRTHDRMLELFRSG